MPQLYPMSWTMLTSFMLAFFIILMTIIFFLNQNILYFLMKMKIQRIFFNLNDK